MTHIVDSDHIISLEVVWFCNLPCRKERKGEKARKKEWGAVEKEGESGERREWKRKREAWVSPPHFHLAAKLTLPPLLPPYRFLHQHPGAASWAHDLCSPTASCTQKAPILSYCSAIAVLKNLNFWAMKLKLSFFCSWPHILSSLSLPYPCHPRASCPGSSLNLSFHLSHRRHSV